MAINNIQLLSNASFEYPELPVWRGAQAAPGRGSHLPFSIETHSSGLLVRGNKHNTIDSIVTNYSNPEYQFITPPPGTSDWGTHLGREKVRTMERFVPDINGLRVLEIGGGNLFLAKALIEKYRIRRYLAVDPALRDWPECTQVESLQAYFPTELLDGEQFDLVLAHNCLEHVQEVEKFLRGIRKLLSIGGKVFLTFPDVGRQFADGDLNAFIHEHLIYLNEVTAKALFVRCGFAITHWESVDDLASCLLIASEITPSSLTIDLSAVHQLLCAAIIGYGIRLPEAVRELKADIASGRSIAFYGATNGLNNLMSLTSIGQSLPIVDSDRTKNGRYLPLGLHEIQWVGNVDLQQFDRIYVTAGSFQPNIVNTLTQTHKLSQDKIKGLFRSL